MRDSNSSSSVADGFWPEADEPLWRNVEVVEVNRERPRATFVSTGPGGSPTNRISLNGPWRFHFAASPEERCSGFESPDFGDSDWVEIDVPSHPELRGYGEAIYRNVNYAFDRGDELFPFPEVPEDGNGVSSYRRRFSLPEAWAGKRIFAHFAGADAALYVWLNGRRVGYSEDSRTAAEFDLTPFLEPGENLLAVQVFRFCTGSWLEDQDMWDFSGLYRDVFL